MPSKAAICWLQHPIDSLERWLCRSMSSLVKSTSVWLDLVCRSELIQNTSTQSPITFRDRVFWFRRESKTNVILHTYEHLISTKSYAWFCQKKKLINYVRPNSSQAIIWFGLFSWWPGDLKSYFICRVSRLSPHTWNAILSEKVQIYGL